MDASIAFIIVLFMAQLCLLWTDSMVSATIGMHEQTQKQKELISASDRLINDPKCLAKVENHRVVPQTIDTTKNASVTCYQNYSINEERGGIKRLVFLDEQGGEAGVLEVW